MSERGLPTKAMLDRLALEGVIGAHLHIREAGPRDFIPANATHFVGRDGIRFKRTSAAVIQSTCPNCREKFDNPVSLDYRGPITLLAHHLPWCPRHPR